MFPVWAVERGEALSFALVAVVLLLSSRIIARAMGVAPRLVDDQIFWGILVFVISGRLAHMALTTPVLLADPMVVIRFTDGLQPLAGATGVLAWSWWRGRLVRAFGEYWAVAACGLVVASIAYDLGCPVREACMGATAPSPWGMPLHGLVEPRLPTPLMDGIVLLVVLAIAVRVDRARQPACLGWTLLAALAAMRLALTPLSAGGFDAPVMAVLAVMVVLSTAMAVRAAHSLPSEGPTASSEAPGAPASD
ncbi:MAG: prolipoprotein diacylglyceryl transferase [Chloroflexi bacterium]|nr:prolipoprotein diacylglyceryl transferase [Chloroflexota bacterium]